MEDLFPYLSAGGDVGIWLVALGLYRLDKRLTILEVMQQKA